MTSAEIQMTFVTPAILAGADQKQAEFRAPSLRGQLRWWMRAMEFDQDYEDQLFGSAAAGKSRRSQVLIRTEPITKYSLCKASDLSRQDPDYFLWPLRREQDARGVIPAGTTVSFSMHVRGEGSEDAFDILKVFLLLGSMGTRSRRCYGSVWPKRVVLDGEEWTVPTTEEALAEELEELFAGAGNLRINVIGEKSATWAGAVKAAADFLSSSRCGSEKFNGVPTKYGRNDHDAGLMCLRPEAVKNPPKCVYRAALGLPLTQRYTSQNAQTVESSVSGMDRYASPVHLKIVPMNGGFLPLAIYFPGDLIKPNTPIQLKSRQGGKTLPVNNELFYLLMLDETKCHCLVDLRERK